MPWCHQLAKLLPGASILDIADQFGVITTKRRPHPFAPGTHFDDIFIDPRPAKAFGHIRRRRGDAGIDLAGQPLR